MTLPWWRGLERRKADVGCTVVRHVAAAAPADAGAVPVAAAAGGGGGAAAAGAAAGTSGGDRSWDFRGGFNANRC